MLTAWRYVPSSYRATLHQNGLNIGAFYFVTRKCLEQDEVKKLFADECERLVRDSIFFCSCRALLNGLAGLRARSPRLVLRTIKTILKEDQYWINILRLPLFVVREIWVSLFPPKLPPARE